MIIYVIACLYNSELFLMCIHEKKERSKVSLHVHALLVLYICVPRFINVYIWFMLFNAANLKLV